MSTLRSRDIASRLRKARQEAGFKSAKAFALFYGTKPSTYAQHESGARKIKSELIVGYSAALQLNPHWLLTGSGVPYLKNHTDTTGLSTAEDLAPYGQQINLKLLRKILIAIEPLIQNPAIKLTYPELIDYCFEVFNTLSQMPTSLSEKEKVISLTVSSLQLGSPKVKKVLKLDKPKDEV